ncbi:MAG: HMA2 domain-containing protein, partial [Microcystis sp.]
VLVVKYYVPPLNWERTLTKVIAEIAETSIAWWETFRRASIEVGELLIKSLHQTLAAVAKSIDQLGESLLVSNRAEVEQLEESIPMGETFTPSTAPEIVHQIAGRIRWRIPRLRKDAGYAAQLQRILESVEGVTEVKINSIAASLAVSYT